MSELWEHIAALGETRHQIVMILLDSALPGLDSARALDACAAADEINMIVDATDKTNAVAISRAHDVLNGRLAQLQFEALTGRAGGSRQIRRRIAP